MIKYSFNYISTIYFLVITQAQDTHCPMYQGLKIPWKHCVGQYFYTRYDYNKSYSITYVSFQITSSLNISTINTINILNNTVIIKDLGRGYHKRLWRISLKLSRYIYLKTYNNLNIMNHMIKKYHIWVFLWKWCFSYKYDAQAWFVTSSFAIYMEFTYGDIYP